MSSLDLYSLNLGVFDTDKITGAAAEGKQIEVWDARPKNKAAQSLGSLGGKAGKGAAKRRSKAHYAKMVAARAEQRKARAEEEK